MYVHMVKKGESLHQIERVVGVSREEIAEINQLDEEQLIPGISILIPTRVPTSLATYTVQEGDTLRTVARRYHMPEKIILAANQGLHAELLPKGRVLTLPIPIVNKQTIEVNLRLEVGEIYDELEMIEEAKDCLSSVSLATFYVQENGSIVNYGQPEFLQAKVRQTGGRSLLLIAPEDEKAAIGLLCRAENRRRFFSDLRTLVEPDGYRGVHLEFLTLDPEWRTQFLTFVRELSVRLKRIRGLLYLAVPPHEEDDPDHPEHGMYDLEMLGKYADRIVWNVSDCYGRLSGPPMSLAPLHLIKRSLDYARTVVHPSRLLLGLPFYGCDWLVVRTGKRRCRLLPLRMLKEHMGEDRQVKQVYWDEMAMAPMFTYRNENGDLREVWYEDARSIAAKLHVVRELGLAGISCQVFPRDMTVQWRLLTDSFVIAKDTSVS